jgi:nitrogen regulatory protein PII
MEIAVNDDFLERTVETIRSAMQLDDTAEDAARDAAQSPTCSLFVLPIDEAVQIYREVRGPEAV